MFSQIRAAIVSLLIFTVLTGLIYPVAVTGIAQVVFPHQANGSLIVENGKVVGSSLIGQTFDDPKYFWGRPSETTPPYNGALSSGSNKGPTSSDLADAVKQRVEDLRKAHPDQIGDVPADLVTASASGLDPDISPAAAEYQVTRVAKARGLSIAEVRRLVELHTESRTFGFFGEPRVNVLELNRALDGK